MKLSQNEKEVLEILRNISGESVDRINNILLSLMIYTLLNYSSKEDTNIPYFGNFLVNKDNNDSVKGFFIPSEFLSKNIIMYEQMKKGNCKVTDIPIFKYFKSENIKTLRSVINEEDINN